MSERDVVDQQGLGYTIRRADVPDDPNNYGQAPDIVSACVLMAALYTRTGHSLRVADEVGSSAAWIGRPTQTTG